MRPALSEIGGLDNLPRHFGQPSVSLGNRTVRRGRLGALERRRNKPVRRCAPAKPVPNLSSMRESQTAAALPTAPAPSGNIITAWREANDKAIKRPETEPTFSRLVHRYRLKREMMGGHRRARHPKR
jgi:hypothetical protein